MVGALEDVLADVELVVDVVVTELELEITPELGVLVAEPVNGVDGTT